MKKTKEDANIRVYTKSDLLEIFPFGRTKLQQLLTAGVLPVVKVGKSYLTSEAQIQRWLLENTGKEIFIDAGCPWNYLQGSTFWEEYYGRKRNYEKTP